MIRFISIFSRDERGATAIEYGIIIAITAVIVIVAMGALNTAIADKYTLITNLLNGT